MKKHKLCGLLAVLSILSSASGIFAEPSTLRTLKVGELDRTYRLYLPSKTARASKTSTDKMPLLLALHAYTGTSGNFETGTGFDAQAEQLGFIVAYPDATGEPQGWNSELAGYGSDDVAFISALIDVIASKYPADTSRVCVTGHSSGAMMAYRLARDLSEKVTAIAPMAGVFLKVDYKKPTHEVAVMHFHALNDATVPYFGGGYYVPVLKTLQYWIDLQKCAKEPTVIVDANGVTGKLWKSASGFGDVTLYTTKAGGHRWLRNSTANLEATEVISRFVMNLPKRKQ